ncbi:redoxin domain-containing protein [Streptomyces prunicolor]|uniref:TlpA family protein disulfide reductase n=1 Tax=Streptomyces prunicolor TaxID=67348 RepID=UPI003866664E|nr:redoxin domain-containing protein [Streptomyces prunicolor]
MLFTMVILALFAACASCLLSVAVALRVKKAIDPLIEEGAFKPTRRLPVSLGTKISTYGEFTDMRGEKISFPTESDGPWILAFQSTSCSGCKSQLPFYKDYLSQLDLPRERVFSFISGDSAGLGEFADEIGQFATIVPADDTVDVGTDLGVTTWPAYLVVAPDGSVVFSSESAAALPELDLEMDESAAVA